MGMNTVSKSDMDHSQSWFLNLYSCVDENDVKTRQYLSWLSILASRPGAESGNLDAMILSRITNFVQKIYF